MTHSGALLQSYAICAVGRAETCATPVPYESRKPMISGLASVKGVPSCSLELVSLLFLAQGRRQLGPPNQAKISTFSKPMDCFVCGPSVRHCDCDSLLCPVCFAG